MRISLIVVAVLPLLLAGACASPQVRAERQAAAMAQMNAEDDAYCKTYGVEKGSPGYVACRNQLTQVRANGATAARSDQAAAGRAMTATGAAMIQNASRPVGTTCMPNGIGGFTCN